MEKRSLQKSAPLIKKMKAGFQDIFSRKKGEEEKILVEVDYREKNSLVASELVKLNFKIIFKELQIGDYLVNGTAIERKTLSDFKQSIISKRIFSQLESLKQYPSRFLIIEGLDAESPYSGSMHENAFRGSVISITSNFNTPVIFTLNEKDTARYISVLARKKQKSEQPIRPSKIHLTQKEQLQFILEGFPNIGPAAAKKLLEQFKSIKQIVNSSEENLSLVLGKKAGEFYNLVNQEY